MNEITKYSNAQLPDTLEDLTQFVLVGKAKLQAYMLKLQTVNKLSVAQEIRDQTLKETQEVSNALIAAEQRIGELLLAIPKQAGRPSENSSTRVEKLKTKTETIKEMGYSKDEASDYQKMAKNPKIVQKVIDEAIANGEVVTKASVMREIKFYKDRISNLEKNAEPKVVTKKVEVEVIPDDYEELKKKAKKASAFESDYKKERNKALEKQNEILRLQDEIEELKRGSGEGVDNANISENVFYFCAICNNFISNVGGLVWLTERIADMPEREKTMFLKAARSFNDWSQVFKDNLERSLENGQTRTDTGIPLLTD